jgi:outer membrane receptor protein involved in Fe transport
VKRLRWPLMVVLTVCWSVSVLWAANTGKISGRVTDATTHESLPGVSVVLVGTTSGAATDVDGNYFILNVPVGTYSLRVSALGYETQNITDVQVLADQTRAVNVELTPTVIQGQEVTVVAQRDVVQKDVSTTVRSVTSNEITQLPVTTYRQVLTREAGVVGTGNNIHIRGGRPDEVLYLVDGMEVKDPQFSIRSLDVSQDAIGEMEVLTAGFSAEYGEAQSAVVNLVIKEGDPVYHGHVEQVSDFSGLSGSHTAPQTVGVNDPAAPPGSKVSNYQAYTYTEATLSGPEPITMKLLPRLGAHVPGSATFFASGTGWGTNTDANGLFINTDPWYRHPLWDLFGTDVRRNQSYTSSNVKLTYSPEPKYKINLSWNQDEAWINPYLYRMSRRFPEDFTQEEITQGMHSLAAIQGLASDAASFPQRFGVDDDGDGRVDEEALNGVDDDGDGLIDEDLQPYSFNANNSIQTDHRRLQQFAATWNHNVNAKTYYTLRLSAFDTQRYLAGENKAPNDYGEASEPFIDLPDSVGRKNGRYDLGEPFTDMNGNHMWDYNNPTNAYPSVNGFVIAGTGLNGNVQQLVPSWANLSSRVYTFKGDMTSQVTHRHQVRGGLEYNYYNTASNTLPYTSIATNGVGIYTDVYRYYPSAAAAYLEDKAEFRDIIVNAGLRVDYWVIPGNFLQHPIAEQPNQTSYIDYIPPDKNGETYVSPRLGIAYSVTEKDVFHFNYGYFYQRAGQDYYFTGVNQLQTGGTPVIGNPSLKPQRTIAYELGVRHQFGADFLLDVSTYYKDITNWINTASENELFYALYQRLIVGTNAAIYYNADYASSRGIELNISKQYGSRFAGRFTYTLAFATGKNSYDIGSDVTRSNYAPPPRETPLAWDRRHQFVLNFSYNAPLTGRPFTVKWLESGWNVNMISQALSGLPYTPTYSNGTNIAGQEFSKNTPWIFQTDVNVSRAFKLVSLNWQLLVEVRNLFDNVNILGWDIAPNTIDTYLNGTPGYVNDTASPNYGQNPKAAPNPAAWGERRNIRLGLSVDF